MGIGCVSWIIGVILAVVGFGLLGAVGGTTGAIVCFVLAGLFILYGFFGEQY
jgi:hypothetical protein